VADSNIADVVQYLRDFVNGFDFTRPGKDQNLGRDLANAEVDQIMVRAEQYRCGPDGDEWEGNSTKSSPWLPGGYKQWKEEIYGWDDMPNRRTGQMLSQTSLFGRTTIEPRLITMIYGVDAPPDRSASPNGFFDPETDGKITDVEKAELAHKAGGNRPARPFYGPGEGDLEALCEVARENLHGYIRTSPYSQG
jgi:hypothetical protein